jgi:hypothetical protein
LRENKLNVNETIKEIITPKNVKKVKFIDGIILNFESRKSEERIKMENVYETMAFRLVAFLLIIPTRNTPSNPPYIRDCIFNAKSTAGDVSS